MTNLLALAELPDDALVPAAMAREALREMAEETVSDPVTIARLRALTIQMWVREGTRHLCEEDPWRKTETLAPGRTA